MGCMFEVVYFTYDCRRSHSVAVRCQAVKLCAEGCACTCPYMLEGYPETLRCPMWSCSIQGAGRRREKASTFVEVADGRISRLHCWIKRGHKGEALLEVGWGWSGRPVASLTLLGNNCHAADEHTSSATIVAFPC